MTVLSVNLNKLALLRNSRGRNFPDICTYARRFIDLGVKGITIHPRPDERHITRNDVYALSELLREFPDVEFNIEGYPSDAFMLLVKEAKPQQCTLVPDTIEQLTSDHGWDCHQNKAFLNECIDTLKTLGSRVSLFLDPVPEMASLAATTGADRIELYTEAYAEAFGSSRQAEVLAAYKQTADTARRNGMGVNAGHDLDLLNLATFLSIGNVLEVSIGHALIIECIDQGLETVTNKYLAICNDS